MSIVVANVDLSSATVGLSGKIDLGNLVNHSPALYTNPAYIRFFNESQCGLQIVLDNGDQEILPAGGWYTHALRGVSNAIWSVIYVMNNPTVTKLFAVYYAPNESLPDIPNLGNSPIGGGTVSNTTLSNENATLGSEIIDVGVAGHTHLFDLFNDHFIWSVLQSGIVHQVLKGQTSGIPLQLGQVGDTTEVLGALQSDYPSILDNTGSGTSIIGGNLQLNETLACIGNATTFNGSVSGQAIICYPVWGTNLKIVVIVFANYSTATIQDWSMPTTLTRGGGLNLFTSGISQSISFKLSGGGVQVAAVKTLATGTADGAVDATNFAHAYGMYALQSTADTIELSANGGACNGIGFFVGR